MRRAGLLLSVTAIVATSTGAAFAGGPFDSQASPTGVEHRNVPVCAAPAAGFAACNAIRHDTFDARGKPVAPAATPSGYTPADLQSAYKLSTAGGSAQTIAIVDAYDDPKAEIDLATYRAAFDLGPCTTANGCFRKVDQRGGIVYPAGDTGWAEEISLDLDMASAICPNCKILLVEADTASLANLAAAVDRAALMGATVISNSYGGREYSTETRDESHYNHPGIPITVSSGDNGYGVQFPAASRYVTAVGGTSLTRSSASARGWSETAWSGAGSGCSAYVSKPVWQKDTSCTRRTVADVSAVADPNTGVAVNDTYNETGWLKFGGTSVAAPIVAGVYALAANQGSANLPYANAASLYDVTSGSNGRCTHGKTTSGAYLCTAVIGYDGPTGLGTPNGIGAF